ncbi:uncharacterized protein LOC129729009 [Wyeomyia smithii]|uniref:uncharacterized protein LOC129729009 n=1 Tax=Wyeomyia smithii TaxID=174621 RepID=UPI002467C4D0|nr:uncharacterized protein LOC129729009 [Wyeomyia smithii]
MDLRCDWIDHDLLEKILRSEKGSNGQQELKIVSFDVSAATKKGDNYASEMYRVLIEYIREGRPEKCSRILKVIPSGEIQRIVMENNNIFPREIAVYRDILPKIHKLLRSMSDESPLSPNCSFITNDPKTMLVFEDLKDSGFEMVDRKRGLGIEETKLVLKKLAKLHACSALVYKEQPEIMEPVLEGAINTNPNRQDFLVFHKMCARQVARLVECWEEPKYKTILEKLQKLPLTTIAKGCQVYTRDDTVFNVLNHDDLWTSNLMFKFKNGAVDDVLMLDYQLAYYGSPGVDLNYFLFGSVQYELREEYWLEFIREYYDVLRETLVKLKYTDHIPSLQEIHVELIRTGFHSVNAVFCLLPLAMMEKTDNAEMDVFLQDNDVGETFRKTIFANPKYEPVLKRALVLFDLLGYFAVLLCGERSVTVYASLQSVRHTHSSSTTLLYTMSQNCEITSSAVEVAGWKIGSFFENVVAADLLMSPEHFRIVDVQVANVAAKTAGYMSLTHRVTVTVDAGGLDSENRVLSYVVKEKSEEVFGGELVDDLIVFPKEIEVYSKFLPVFEQMGKDGKEKFGPRLEILFKTTSSPFTVLVLEDLKPLGFHMKDCSVGLDLVECENVLGKLAKFHAASVVYQEQNGPYSDKFKDGMFADRMVNQFEAYYVQLFRSFMETLEDLRYPPHILETLRLWEGKMYSTLSKLFRCDPAKFNVLNHGDVWINNLQFSENDILLVDYQIAFYGTPSFDVLYFIITSAGIEVRTEKFDHLVKHYHCQLVQSLHQMGAQTTALSLQELQDDITEHGLLACVLAMETLALLLAMQGTEVNMEMVMSNEPEAVEYRKKAYSSSNYVQALDKLIPFMWERGFLRYPQP